MYRSAASTPKFDDPPVVETVSGVQFEILPELKNVHLGVFWKQLGKEWSGIKELPPLNFQYEKFAEKEAWREEEIKLEVVKDINLRLQIGNDLKNRMVQIQNGRLHYNWLGHENGEYPEYENIRPEYFEILDKFLLFLKEEKLGDFQPNQWEITYVNYIPRGTVWDKPEDWIDLFPRMVMLKAKSKLNELESFVGEWHYEIKPQQGRLHVNLKHGKREDNEIIVMTLTARGPICQSEDKKHSLDEGLKLGHDSIVIAFKDLTSDSAHKYWKLRK